MDHRLWGCVRQTTGIQIVEPRISKLMKTALMAQPQESIIGSGGLHPWGAGRSFGGANRYRKGLADRSREGPGFPDRATEGHRLILLQG
jgi:hypothetical protein